MANAIVKKLSFKEQSGLNIGKLTFSALVTPQKASVKNFRLCLPHSTIYSDSITATYRTDGGSIVGNTIKGKGNIIGNNITLSDFAFIVPELNDLSNKLNLVADFSYTDGKAKVSRLSLYSQDTAFKFNANGMFTPFDGCKTWKAKICQLSVNESYLALVFKAARTARIDIPTPLTKLKAITAAATCETNNDNISACGNVNKGKFCEECGKPKPVGALLYKCDKCGWEPENPENPPKFCPECGEKLAAKKFCPECGAEVKASAKFCPECGDPFDENDIK